MSRVFLSHSSANNAEAVAIRDWLAAEGWNDVFLDLDPERGIRAGERWERTLNEAASRCEAVLFLVSRAWLASRWCLKEFNLAHKLNKRLFGVQIEAIPVAELPQDLTGTWQLVDLAAGQDHLMMRVILPRTHEEAHVTFSNEGLARLRNGLSLAGLDARFFAWPPESDPDRPPYHGLKPLEAEDAGIFFGRDAPIVEAIDTLRGLRDGAAPRVLVILGASGAGKSSFLRAGLLPRLARDDRNFLALPVIRPERAAISGENGLLKSIETQLAKEGIPRPRSEIRNAMTAGASALRPLLRALVDKVFAAMPTEETGAKRPALVLAIDQAEELFFGEGATEGEMLLALISELVRQDDPDIIALFTIRSDSYDRLEIAKPLAGVRQQTFALLPMPRGAYQTVIEGPAARLQETRRKLTIEPRLTQQLLEDIEKGGGSDALPLLAFTLEQLCLEYGGGGTLKLADYQAFGGVRGAIEAAVERAFSAADCDPAIPRDRTARLALLRRGLIPWLAGIDPDTASPRRRVARLADIPAEAKPLVNMLVEQRLLATDRVTVRDADKERIEITIEPAHDALLRQWGLLRGWLEEDFAALTTLEGVKRAARDWAANGRHADWLNHSGTRLEEAEKVAARSDLAGDLSVDAGDYLRQCREREVAEQRARLERLEREREEQERRLRDAQSLAAANRRTAQYTGVGLAIAVLFAGLAFWYWQSADRSAQKANTERERAEAIFGVAINETDAIVSQISTQLKDLIGVSRGAIRSILAVIESQFDDMLKSNPDSARLQLSRAKMLSAFVDIYAELGELNEAGRRAKECAAIMRPLVPDDSNAIDMIEGFGLCLEKLGDASLWHGEDADAANAYHDSIALRRRIIAANPQDMDAQMRLAHVLGYQAYVLIPANRLDDAAAAASESLALSSKLVAIDKDNARWQREYVESINFTAMVLSAKAKPDEALPGYKQSADLARELLAKDPDNATLRRFLSNLLGNVADTLMRLGRYEEAFSLLQEDLELKRYLVQIDHENMLWQSELLSCLWRLSTDEAGLKQTDQAIAYGREAVALGNSLITKDPTNNRWRNSLATAFVGLAEIYSGKGGDDEVIATLTQAIVLDLRYPIVFNNRGFAYYRKQNYARAIADYDQAIALEPKYVIAYNNRGNAYYAMQDYDRAITSYGQAIALYPNYAVFYDNRGDAYRAKNDYDRAIADYDRAIELDPKYAIAYNDRGNAYWFKHDYDRAIADYEQAIAIDPKNAVYFDNAGNAYRAKDDYDRAIAAYDRAITLDPNYSSAYNDRGLTYYFKLDYDHAIPDFTQAIKLNPSFAVAYANRGSALRAKGSYEDAIKDLDRAIELAPQFARTFYHRGSAYRAKGDEDHAISDYDQTIRLAPKEPGAYSALCWEHVIIGRAEEALKECNASLDLRANDAYALDGRGYAYFRLGQFDRAIIDFDAALKLESKLPNSLYGRGLAKVKNGDNNGGNADIAAAKAIRSNIANEIASYGIE
jgi:tetratricopeptide (TPR) repeat protein